MRESEEKEILGWIDRRCNEAYIYRSPFKQTSQDPRRFYETGIQMVSKQRHNYQKTSLRRVIYFKGKFQKEFNQLKF